MVEEKGKMSAKMEALSAERNSLQQRVDEVSGDCSIINCLLLENFDSEILLNVMFFRLVAAT